MAPWARGRRHRVLQRAYPESHPGAPSQTMRCVTPSVLLSCAFSAATTTWSDISALLSALELGGHPMASDLPTSSGSLCTDNRYRCGPSRESRVPQLLGTWCPPCGAEMTLLQELSRNFGVQHLAVVAVNIRESSPLIRVHVDTLGITFFVSSTLKARFSASMASSACLLHSSSLSTDAQWLGRSARETGQALDRSNSSGHSSTNQLHQQSTKNQTIKTNTQNN